MNQTKQLRKIYESKEQRTIIKHPEFNGQI